MPVDAAGRVLELLLVLEAAWAAARPGYGLALLSPVAFNALEFAKSQLEWMAEGLTHSLERSKANPFAMRCAARLASALNSSAVHSFLACFFITNLWVQQPPLLRPLCP